MPGPVYYLNRLQKHGEIFAGRVKAMRYLAMQILTWGTGAGSIGSALLLAALQDPPAHHAVELLSLSPQPTASTRADGGRSSSTTTSVTDNSQFAPLS